MQYQLGPLTLIYFKMGYIKGYCTTNLDNWDVNIVKGFCVIPKIGDRVACKYNKSKNLGSLKVCGVIHSYDSINKEPFIIVELNR